MGIKPNGRKHDIDGPIKLLIDSFVKARIISDDEEIVDLHVKKQYREDIKESYCEVEIL